MSDDDWNEPDAFIAQMRDRKAEGDSAMLWGCGVVIGLVLLFGLVIAAAVHG